MNTERALSRQHALTTAERLLNTEDILAAVDPVFAQAALRHWAAAAQNPGGPYRGAAGIFSSPGGLAASLIVGSAYLPDPDAQRAATTRAVRWLAARTLDLAHDREEDLRAGGMGTPWRIYDGINGLAGIGRVLLAALTAGYDTAESGLLAALQTLTAMINTQHGRRPGWWLPADEHSSAMSVHPSGAATTGMAHGIAGPLSLLASAHAAGWSVAGQRAALQSAAHWLLRWRTDAAPSWAPDVTGEELDSDTATPSAGRRDAWCSGAPGIGRALILAGDALADPWLSTAGEAAITSLADRPAHLWDVEGPTVCHGYAGVLQSATTSQGGTGERAATAVTDAFNPRLTFAFRHLHHGVPSDEPGLLTGSAGIALALADHGQLPVPPVPARWDSLMLLS